MTAISAITFVASVMISFACGFVFAQKRGDSAMLGLTTEVGGVCVTTNYTGPSSGLVSMGKLHNEACLARSIDATT